MTETIAKAYTGLPGIAGDDVVDWLTRCAATFANWTVIESAPGKVLLRRNGAAPTPEIVVHGTATPVQIKVGYAALGGIVDWETTPSALYFTGMRNITGTTSNIAGTNGVARAAEYPDAVLLILSSALPNWVCGFCAGGLIAPFDANDAAKGLTGEALFTGRPDAEGTTGGWLVGSTTNAHASVFRASTTWLPVAAAQRYTPPNANLLSIVNVERLVPYSIAPPSASNLGGQIGVTKYIRMYRRALPHETALVSNDVTSTQAWFTGGTGNSTIVRNHFILWDQDPVVVV